LKIDILLFNAIATCVNLCYLDVVGLLRTQCFVL